MNRTLVTYCVLSLAILRCDREEGQNVRSEVEHAALSPAAQDDPRPHPDPGIAGDDAAARIDGIVIPRREIDAALHRTQARFSRQRRSFTAHEAARQRERLLAERIDEVLLDRHLAQATIAVSDDEVEAAIAEEIERAFFGSRENFQRHLRDRGTTIAHHRDRVRRDLATRRLLRHEASPSPAELQELYRRITRRSPTVDRIRIESVAFPPTTPVDLVVEVTGDVDDAEDFRALRSRAQRYLEPRWVDRQALDRDLARTLFSVTIPGVSPPIDTPAGVQMYWISERSVAATDHFDSLAPTIRARAEDIHYAKARRELLKRLRASATIEIY